MISSATGMKAGERYAVESSGHSRDFSGFFLDGKYYLGPELLTSVGWLEGQEFYYDELDAVGDPAFPGRIAGTIEDLTLTLVDGASLKLKKVVFHAPDDEPSNQEFESSALCEDLYVGKLRGKVVVITGASSGIGRLAALAFACEGARLVLAARDDGALFDVLDECTECGTAAVAVATDVTSSEQMLSLGAQAAAFGNGRIDIWINNAGVGAVGSFEETPLEAHEQVLQTDLIGYLRGAYVAWPYFKKQKSGILINTLSLGSWVAQPYAAAYSASKYGLRGLSEALRGELHSYPDIHVCDIYPAVMDTPGFRDAGNYTGHSLRPPFPIYDPHNVAKAMVDCAVKPRVSTTVGSAAHLVRMAHFLLPGFNRLAGWITQLSLDRRPQSARTPGNLFEPTDNVRRAEGGWRNPQRQVPVFLVATASVLILGCLVALYRGGRMR
ncbi:SDR family oxidoreductase [Pseudomonas sp. NA-150]|uniref:SDR family oxidoreductase n=1 Tax=Pseudomonas sp. NA-150 TaxID=3367525 RepID=UPI0037C512A2